ncbi:MAG: uroporphyrinogen-III synthase, partial [Rhodoferax sp.]|nr:uroporphyrinogen-III synthase [Rhodoferax sp.]
MRVIVTRPLAEAERWVQGLAQQGIEALAVPLIEIRPLAQTGAIAAAWRRCRQCQAIMFVSAAAVAHFFAARPPDADLGTPEQGPRLWAPGPGTVAALVRQGVDPRRIDAPAVGSGQYDSEALWAQVGA